TTCPAAGPSPSPDLPSGSPNLRTSPSARPSLASTPTPSSPPSSASAKPISQPSASAEPSDAPPPISATTPLAHRNGRGVGGEGAHTPPAVDTSLDSRTQPHARRPHHLRCLAHAGTRRPLYHPHRSP